MAHSAIVQLREAFPSSQIVVVGKKMSCSFWRLCPEVDTIIESDTRFKKIGFMRKKLKEFNRSKTFVLAESFRSAFLLRLWGVHNLIGKAVDGRRLLLKAVVNCNDFQKRHRAEEYSHILGLVPAPTQESEAKSANALPPQPKSNIVGFFPGAARGSSKMWPTPHFAKLAQLLDSEPFPLLPQGKSPEFRVFGGPTDQHTCSELSSQLSARVALKNLCGKTNLEQLVSALKECALVVANDSGGAHLSAWVGTPTVVIFGATDPTRTRPLGEHVEIVAGTGKKSEAISSHSQEAQRILQAISPEQVVEAVKRIF